ncbi:hypothetical protein MM236_08425 [Belliella sp. DSM 107340]|uniref:MetA-pathway of phenol degradation n=1 Tax=Belliella calami TaxID=2923436 RepID=A0ABS9UN04_9BACT|nr:hypothetical protein [Belliella calami]MCH7398012.1 hypothetical protein [Belliella calami]
MQSFDLEKTSRKYFLLSLLLLLSVLQPVLAQQTPQKIPIPTEFLIGNNRMFYQMVVKRKFTSESNFGILSVSSLSVSYQNDLDELDMAIPVLMTYQVYKGFGLVSGITVNNSVGVAPLIGAQHSFTNKKWVSVTIFSAFLNESKNIELFGIYEYKPQLSQSTNLYSRIQFMYIHNTKDNHHARSFIQFRAGLKKQDFNFGLAANLDQYGVQKTFKPNYGLFVGWAFY